MLCAALHPKNEDVGKDRTGVVERSSRRRERRGTGRGARIEPDLTLEIGGGRMWIGSSFSQERESPRGRFVGGAVQRVALRGAGGRSRPRQKARRPDCIVLPDILGSAQQVMVGSGLAPNQCAQAASSVAVAYQDNPLRGRRTEAFASRRPQRDVPSNALWAGTPVMERIGLLPRLMWGGRPASSSVRGRARALGYR